MTDPTASRIVEILRNRTGITRWADTHAADLIQQQAEEIAALRKVIEDAPHETGCSELISTYECDCWKSKALTGVSDD